MCDCDAETETASYFFLRCHFFANERQKLRDDVYRIDAAIKNLNEESLTDALLYGSDTICYIQATKRFERPLIDQC